MTVEHTLDTTGLICPEPIMLLHGAIRDAALGDTVIMTATDPASERDVNKFCTYLGHTLASIEKEKGVLTFHIVKGV